MANQFATLHHSSPFRTTLPLFAHFYLSAHNSVMKICPQVITLVSVLVANVIILALIFGPTPLAILFAKAPISHLLAFAIKVAVVALLCAVGLRSIAWFATVMFSIIAVFAYTLGTFVVNYRDTLNPLMKDAIECLRQAKTHEERVACRKAALTKLRAKFVSKTNTNTNPKN